MGCTISPPAQNLVRTITNGGGPEVVTGGTWSLRFGGFAVFSCDNGQTLLIDGEPAPFGEHSYDCFSNTPTEHDFSFLTCQEPTIPPAVPLPDVDPNATPLPVVKPDATSVPEPTLVPEVDLNVTSAPPSSAPISSGPVTAAPVYFAPITAAPATAAPISAKPASAAPVSAAPISAAPITSVNVMDTNATLIPEHEPTLVPFQNEEGTQEPAPIVDLALTPEYVNCLIPNIEGIIGYQAATDVTQATMVELPISIVSNNVYYKVPPHDSVVFVCADSSQVLKYNGMALGPSSVNFYAYHCEVEEGSPEEEQGFDLPLSCEDPPLDGGRRHLRGWVQ